MTQPSKPDDGTIRITAADANSAHVDDLLKRHASLRGDPGITRDTGRKFYYQNWFILMFAGLVAAFIGWALIEQVFDDNAYIEGTIAEVKPGDPVLPILGTIHVGNHDYAVLKETRVPDGKGKWKEIDFDDLRQGMRVGVYAEESDVENLPPIAAFIEPEASTGATDDLDSVMQKQMFGTLFFFSIVAGVVGLVLGAADGLVCRLPRRAVLAGAIGLLVGVFGGFIFSCFANAAYAPISAWAMRQGGGGAGGITTTGFVAQVGGRALGWMLAGISMGLGQGLAIRSGKILLYGFLGGLLGGLFGGLLFDPINFFVSGIDQPSAALSRAIAICVIGAAVGFMIGIVEILARDAWLRMVAGPLAGKEFLIFKNVMAVGASPKSDIYLFNDEAVAQSHARIRATGDTYEIEALSDVYPLTVNNRSVQRARLRHGDQIGLGRTVFVFQRKLG